MAYRAVLPAARRDVHPDETQAARSWALELADTDIAVNAVAPDPTDQQSSIVSRNGDSGNESPST
ncbi:hypothetical protein EYW47_40505, partial [Paraburkholderia silviterrae]